MVDRAAGPTNVPTTTSECPRQPMVVVCGTRFAGPWHTVDEVELATLAWVHWHNNQRLHSHCSDVPPAEFEDAYTAQQADQQLVGNP